MAKSEDHPDPARLGRALELEAEKAGWSKEDPGSMGERGLPPAAETAVSVEARLIDGLGRHLAATEVAGSSSSFSQ